MQHHPICRRILQLEERAADLTTHLALSQQASNRAQVNEVKSDLDCVLLELREAYGERAHLLETLGMPPVLGWASRGRGCDIVARNGVGALH